jgi:cytochrome P450
MLGRFKSLAPKTSFRKSCTRAHAYIDYYIRQSLDSSSPASNSKSPDANRDEPHRGQRSLVQNLAAQTDDMEFIRSQVIQGMLAAQETIAVLISNAIFLLARHPNVYTALRTAVLIEGEGLFTFHALSNFKPLQNILNEGTSPYQLPTACPSPY